MSLVLPNPVSGFSSRLLDRRVRIDTLAADTACVGAWLFRDKFVTTRPNEDRIQRVENLADETNPLSQNFGVDRAPQMVNDSLLNRRVADFDDDYDSVIQAADSVDYTAAFSMAVVFRNVIDPSKPFQSLIGRFGGVSPERSYIALTSSGNVVAGYGDGAPLPGAAYTNNTWAMAIMGYNGTDTVSLSLNGSTWATQSVTSEPVTTTLLQFGFNAAQASTTRGLIDAGFLYNVDLSQAANASQYADLISWARGYYGSVVEFV